ncbi:hypothetical protein I3U46_08380 [Mycobacteroides abscessus subsp. massiliense]|uniref:hypothetical protein n=1 Tax=Mycobacteroides abscessus TaxID=36809 RepID=UPI0019CFAAC0|nr:hypothetical protein [Mycobacteroides abscessus]MBN7524321.1 hypothetical protein [Mycobacteroides abscessus subsp. massiliense]
MSINRFGAALAVAGALAFPLAACGSGSSTPAPTVTVTSAPPTLSPGFRDSYCNINSATREACRQSDSTAAKRAATAQAPRSQHGGIPWWAWALIVPGGLVGLCVLGFKALEWSDERTISRANDRVDELDARAAARASRVLDYDEWDDEEDDEDDDELPAEDMDFLHRVTEPTPSAPIQPAPAASGGNLLSSLRQQSQ